ncbi:MAG: 30S ribosomal protein S6 [Sulfurovum sp.]
MTCYETLFVIKPTLTEEETVAQIEKITAILTKEGAELVATNDMGMRKLAYPVEKHARGYYTILFFKAEGTTIQELERNLKINEEVIKFLTIKYTKVKEIAQFNKLVDIEGRKSAAQAAKSPKVETPAPVEEAPVVETPVAEVPVETTEPVAEKIEA